MKTKSYHPYAMMEKITKLEDVVGQHGIDISVLGSQNESQERDINEIKSSLISIEGSLNSMSTRVTALETPKVLSATPFETGETYKGKPVKKVALPLNNSSSLNIGTSWTDIGIGIGTLPVGKVLNAYIISDESYVGGGINFNFKNAVSSGANITAKAAVSPTIGYPADLVFEYIEKDPEPTN